MRAAVECRGISKQYRLGERRKYGSLRESITNAFAVRASPRSRRETFWALHDVSFDIEQGEVVGIIGRNGAGKSTLLKILSGITEPTTGTGRIHGRIGSLLEVGTGFHPELTGRENIFLNGAILGMRRSEIVRHFDEIVDFAEIGPFLDTPVKRYSTGMHMRLAFSVAAHLQADILLVDEVLAVGDAAFQSKCLRKMEVVGSAGRTVLFVSHNLGMLRAMCTRALLLDNGQLVAQGSVPEILAQYADLGGRRSATPDLRVHPGRQSGCAPVIVGASVKNSEGVVTEEISQNDSITIEIEYEAPSSARVTIAGFILHNSDGIEIGNFNTLMALEPSRVLPNDALIRFTLDARQLIPDSYTVSLAVAANRHNVLDRITAALAFTVHSSDIFGTGYHLDRSDGLSVLQAGVDVMAALPSAHAGTELI